MAEAPQIAILGAGTFVKTQYIPRLAEISNLVSLKAMWSRTEVPQLTYMFLAWDRLTRDLIIFWYRNLLEVQLRLLGNISRV